MRVLVFFDLPMVKSKDLAEYRKFRKFLIKNGFGMVQESVYSKLTLNTSASNSIIELVKKNAPVEGNVQALVITENQFNKIQIIVGEKKNKLLDSDSRLVKL